MGEKTSGPKCFAFLILSAFIMGCYLTSLPRKISKKPALPSPIRNEITSNHTEKKRLAILVPFRDCFEELLQFVPHMHKFLNKQKIPFHIFVVQQTDNNRFNRAALINVGYLQTKNEYDYIAMHDVDLLPLNDNLKYDYPASGPVHISSPATHPKYHYDTFIGGIMLINRDHYELVNGMSNIYWGWGLEDDEFYMRLTDAHLPVIRPSNITTGPDNTFSHTHEKTYRIRDKRKCFNQLEMTNGRDPHTGLQDVTYTVTDNHMVTIDGMSATVINVQLLCNHTATPWCQCP